MSKDHISPYICCSDTNFFSFFLKWAVKTRKRRKRRRTARLNKIQGKQKIRFHPTSGSDSSFFRFFLRWAARIRKRRKTARSNTIQGKQKIRFLPASAPLILIASRALWGAKFGFGELGPKTSKRRKRRKTERSITVKGNRHRSDFPCICCSDANSSSFFGKHSRKTRRGGSGGEQRDLSHSKVVAT